MIRRLLGGCILALFLAGMTFGAIQITGETKVEPYKAVKLALEGDVKDAFVTWDVSDEDKIDIVFEEGGKFWFVASPGVYKVKARAFRFGKDGKPLPAETARATVTVGTPVPPDPVNPAIERFTADPSSVAKGGQSTLTWVVKPSTATVTLEGLGVVPLGSKVVVPTTTTSYTLIATVGTVVARSQCTVTVSDIPPPGPSPIPAPGFRVMIFYETSELPKMPAAQQQIIYGKTVRDYLRSKCVKDADNPASAFVIWDKDVDTTSTHKLWQDAMKRPRASHPWVLISTGSSGYEGPLPANVTEMMALLTKYGG